MERKQIEGGIKMGYVYADNLKSAKRKVAKNVKRFNKTTNFPTRAVDWVKPTRKKGLYAYATRERR
jgi:hypothetical protein